MARGRLDTSLLILEGQGPRHGGVEGVGLGVGFAEIQTILRPRRLRRLRHLDGVVIAVVLLLLLLLLLLVVVGRRDGGRRRGCTA